MATVGKVTEITSESSKSFDDAINAGIARATKTIDNVSGAWVKEQQVVMSNGKITGYRVTLKLTFILKD